MPKEKDNHGEVLRGEKIDSFPNKRSTIYQRPVIVFDGTSYMYTMVHIHYIIMYMQNSFADRQRLPNTH